MSGPSLSPFGQQEMEDLAAMGFMPNCALLTVSGGANFARGELGYLHTDGTVRKAINTGETTAYCRVMALAAVASGASGSFLAAPGIVDGLSGGTINAQGYVGGVAGAITTTRPTGSVYLKAVGYWISATVFAFFPDPNIKPFTVSDE